MTILNDPGLTAWAVEALDTHRDRLIEWAEMRGESLARFGTQRIDPKTVTINEGRDHTFTVMGSTFDGVSFGDSGFDAMRVRSLVATMTGVRAGAWQSLVAEFHTVYEVPRQPLPTLDVDPDVSAVRVKLLREETEEFATAVAEHDLVAVADALADVMYIAIGSAEAYGIDLDAIFREVHRSNMSKLDAHGRPIKRADGKVLKSDLYTPPNLAPILAAQNPLS